MGFYDLIMEGNALQTINAIKTKHKNWSQFEHIVDGVQECMRLLRSCRIERVKRNTNSPTHRLAREATKNVIDNDWLEDFFFFFLTCLHMSGKGI
jgi:hypothetical protein